MKEKPDLESGMHLILCQFALSHVDGMKRGFFELLDVPLPSNIDDQYNIETVKNLLLYSLFNLSVDRILGTNGFSGRYYGQYFQRHDQKRRIDEIRARVEKES